jgi:hypothetical protein
MILQRDYGGFDSAFFGVTLSLKGEKDWALYQKLRVGESFPIEGLLSEDELFHVLQLATVASHEIRHFHDSLISPFGARAFRARVSVALNSLQLLDQIIKSGANCVPFPMSQWCGLNDKQRNSQKKGWGSPPAGSTWREMPIPQISRREVRELDAKAPVSMMEGPRATKRLIRGGLWYKDKLEALASDSVLLDGKPIQSWEIFELSALLVQMADIDDFENGRGFRWSERFAEYIMKTEASRYGDILRLAGSLWRERDEHFDLYRTSLMASWSILGAYSPDNPRESPANRFACLFRYLKEHGFSAGIEDANSLFNLWSSALKLSTPDDGLKHTSDLFKNLDMNLALAIGLDIKWKHLFEEFKSVVGGLSAASSHLRKLMATNVSVYVDPDRYLNEHKQFPNIIIRTIIDEYIKFSKDQVENIDVDHLEREDGGPKTIFTELGVASAHNFVTLRQSVEMSSLIGVSDLFFRDRGIRQFDAKRARRIFEKDTGVLMREVLK